jgi:hypothetical protein
MALLDEQQFAKTTDRLQALLKKDVENQNSREEAVRMLDAFKSDPKAWLDTHLNPKPGEHKPEGYEAFFNATVDWSKWVTRQD